MEGAAFAYACSLSGVPYAQVRAISNLVERRNRKAWRMDLPFAASTTLRFASSNTHDAVARLLAVPQ